MIEVEAPDGVIIEFPDGTDDATIKQVMAKNYPKPAAPEQNPNIILPWFRNQEGEIDTGMPSIARGIMDALTLPGEVYAGKTQMVDPETGRTSQEVIRRSADLAAIASPTSAGSKSRLMRTPQRSQGPQLTEGGKVVAAGNRANVRVPRAVASDSPVVGNIGTRVKDVPVIGRPLERAAEQSLDDLQRSAGRVQSQYGSGSRAIAGGRVRSSLKSTVDDVLKPRVSSPYDDVAKLTNPNVTTSLDETIAAAKKIAAERANAKLSSKGSTALNLVDEAISGGGKMNYEGIKRLRSEVIGYLDDPMRLSNSGYSQSDLMALKSALTKDLKRAAKNAGGEDALKAFNRANREAAIAASKRGEYDRFLGRFSSDEKLVTKILDLASDGRSANIAQLRRVKAAVDKETWDDAASAVLSSVARDVDGQFSPGKFATFWNKTLSKSGKRLLFGGRRDLLQALDDIATVSSRFKELEKYANHSQSANAVTGFGLAAWAWADPVSAIGAAIGATGFSRIMSKPASVKYVSQFAKAKLRYVQTPTQANLTRLKTSAAGLSAMINKELGSAVSARQLVEGVSGGSENAVAGENQGYPPNRY